MVVVSESSSIYEESVLIFICHYKFAEPQGFCFRYMSLQLSSTVKTH